LPKRIAILAGAFNPLTRAHIALAQAASSAADEVIWVVPRVYPHKRIEGARLEQRLEMLYRTPYRVETTEGGLFIEIAREMKAREKESEIFFVCGRDAAERILNWDYGEPGFAQRMMQEFGLLVAARQGEFIAPPAFTRRIIPILLNGSFDDISSTEVRRRIAAEDSWEHLVPEEIVDLVRSAYGRR